MIRRTPGLGLAALLAAGACPAQSLSLLFAPGLPQVLTAWKDRGALGQLDDQEIALGVPGGSGFRSRKLLPLQALHVFQGDPEGRGDFTAPFVVGAIDALLVLPEERTLPAAPRVPFVSVARRSMPVFSGGLPRLLDHAALFRWLPGGEVQVLLEQAHLHRALGLESPSVDLDAACQDEAGNLYLSLALVEPAGVSRYRAGDLIFLPAAALARDPQGMVAGVAALSAGVLAREPDLDAMVQHSGLADSGGRPVAAVGNLACLEVDPGGGTFLAPAAPQLGPLPNLLFGGGGVGFGTGLCSTAAGGSIASVAGVALGSAQATTGAQLGLEDRTGGPAACGLGALAVAGPPAPGLLLVEDQGGRFVQPASAVRLRWAGAEPGRQAFLFLGLASNTPGRFFAPLRIDDPWLAAPVEWFLEGVPLCLPLGAADARGGGTLALAVPPALRGPLLVLGQSFGLAEGTGLGLSLPAPLQWW